jgi:hypothetical protein
MKQLISNIQNERESVKVMKLSKSYNWEIKLYKDEDEGAEEVVKRLQCIDALLRQNFKREENGT